MQETEVISCLIDEVSRKRHCRMLFFLYFRDVKPFLPDMEFSIYSR